MIDKDLYITKYKVTGREVGEWQRLIGDICDLTGEKDHKKMAYRLAGIPKYLITDWYTYSRSWKVNPGALFNKWVKEYKQSLK
jgi:hypothetical protein